ncbi:hypothetical protein KQI88_10365 [Alkaliphilus sp. MSJ-5]|uniref:Uncharacterized protein n=1 Tax=Alkaliphilus flagellatus TaxID=2841507 RepID=A0ABS6G2W8_9FIRM|nr:hypothetical protein [Alkaliphilus flagellatus]MBU5676822.1 hypothetical protein [Alkaliphilus flagellatus]
MIYYLLDAYKAKIYDMQRRTLRDLTKKEINLFIITIIIGIAALGIMLIFHDITMVYIVTWAILICIGIIVFKNVTKESIANYSNNLVEYNKKLDSLRNTLKNEFNLYSVEKIEILINACNEELNKKELSNKLFEPLVKVFTHAILPVIAFVLGLAVEKVNFIYVIEYSILIIFIIVYLTGFYYMVYPPFETIINKERYIIKSLRDELNDIMMIDFNR